MVVAVAIVVLILKTIYIAIRNKSDFLSLPHTHTYGTLFTHSNYTPSGIHGKILVFCVFFLYYVTWELREKF